MTKKDYIQIAEVIKKANSECFGKNGSMQDGVYIVTQHIVDMLQKDNPAFDKSKFFNFINK